jgi:hypothetical protein
VQEPVEHRRGDGGIPKAPAQSAIPTARQDRGELRYRWLITWKMTEAPPRQPEAAELLGDQELGPAKTRMRVFQQLWRRRR